MFQSDFFTILVDYINVIFLMFTIILFSGYTVMGYLATKHTLHYRRKNSFGDLSKVMASPLAPSITIIAPAYNEGMNIVENVRSLLSLNYVDYEVMVVNDGSKDDTLEKMINAYDLVKIEQEIDPNWQSKPIRGIYKSKQKAFHKLTVIDKENGGKSDALNTGMQLSNNRYVGCIDVDCLLLPDALLHVVKSFFQRSGKRVIAVGGVIRVANSCIIDGGELEEVRLPKNWLAKFQLLEYTRSFILGRMAWGSIDSLLIISGAFGFFDREIALAAGGYDTNTVGEDMEIVFRMRRYMHERDLPYTVEYIPDPLCWTEVPEEVKIFVNQRDRWSRGNLETLTKHKDMFFNPKYGRLGMLSYPYWFFYEWLAPLLEFFGFLSIILFYYLGILNFQFFIAITAAVFSFSVMFSFFAIFWEVYAYNQYKTKDILVLMVFAILEPFIFHPLVTYSAVRGNYKKLFKIKSGWGTITRKGFTKAA
ncbi:MULTISPECIES: glycosyltransferase family 2 protein [unclassified Cellulophaga]|uniref:glycosyltransferase family 2 protein n=1 Tax=unclassified Cellulophaga TaxID=2634405 RepID=UPI000C2C768B|nr:MULTISPECIES: glycosyltransferase [unclassified Cellulophaga]MDO6492580.1 glycosyltransferase [Cellulophaga sp. 2_MG-2023]MDO6493682.1 glycosyltransferase [Cellulophaga sp. 3_MG-2023]PKB44303.1 cellulose synthase/poly-beta-1,6-N-acetylglucosamine synthase-like glycosyltransferase [Cellulophaga sp. RHA19]